MMSLLILGFRFFNDLLIFSKKGEKRNYNFDSDLPFYNWPWPLRLQNMKDLSDMVQSRGNL